MPTFKVTQAYTGETLAKLSSHDAEAVDKMLITAEQLHHKGALPAYQRIKILQNLATLIEAEQADFAKLIASEGGKPLTDAIVEVTRAIDGVHIAIAELRHSRGEEIPMDLSASGADRLAFTTLEPIGVVLAISAFNHPLNLAIHQAIPAIASGCPVILKPAKATPLCALRLAELATKAGLPEGWFQVALTDTDNSERLASSDKIAFLSFIGSKKVGWYLKSRLAAGVRCALEHGGVAPVIFDEYADIDGFVSGVAKAGFYHAGQVCVSVQKIFAPKDKAELIAHKIAKIAENLMVGDAISSDTDIGPLINPAEVDRAEQWVKEAVEEGATLITGGARINAVSFAPSVLLNPSESSKVSTEEIFAPVICVYSYDKIKEAVAIANSLEVAFQASVFSDNLSVALKTAQSLNASAVMINDYTTFRVDWMPFAGRKQSGYGTGGIGYTMRDMLSHKLIVMKA